MSKQPVSYQELIKAEYAKCLASPVYFMRHYVKIQHPMRGKVLFDLYPFQESTLQSFHDYKFNIILKSRQMGISTLVSAFALWNMIFHKEKNILIVSLRQEDAKDVITKVRFANDELPTWLKIKCIEDNRLSLKFANGSQIKAASTTKKSGVGQALSLLIIDEAALIEEAEELWVSAQPTLSCLDKRELILTDTGLIRMEDLITKDTKIGFNDININVHTSTEISNASHFYKSDKSDMYRITFESGGSILATKNHPLMTKTGWKSVETLVPNEDYVLSKYNQNAFGTPIDYTTFSPDIRVDAVKYDTLSNDEIAYLCGLWIAEGHFLNNSTKGIGITNTDAQITDWLKHIGFKQRDDRHYTFSSVWMFNLLKWIGCDGTAHSKRVPFKILSASKQEQICFLQGLFDGDGCSLKNKGIKLTSVSYELLSNVRCMLLNFGIYTYIRNVTWKSTKSTVIKDKSKVFFGFELYIGGWDAQKFYEDIGFGLKRKQNGQLHLSKKSIKRIYPDKEAIKNLIFESGLSIRKFSTLHNIFMDRYLWSSGKGISISSIETLLQSSNPNSKYYKIIKEQYCKDTSEYYDRVVSVEYEKSDFSYDLKVPTKECFVANGYINHNTGGSCIILSCVTKDTMVITEKGIKKVEDFIDKSKVGGYKTNEYSILGVNGVRHGNLFQNNGIQPTKVINTKFSSLECTYNHKLWAYKIKDKKFDWYESSQLEVGDFISLYHDNRVWGHNDEITGFNPCTSSKIKNPFNPKTITPELAYFLGLYVSEGSSYKVMNGDRLMGGSITITCGDDISLILDKLGFVYNCLDGLHYTISCKNLIEFMEHVGFDLSYKANQKQIPSRLLEMSEENIKWLLKGIFDGDGCATKKQVKLTSTSETLIDQVRVILTNFGILSSKYMESVKTMNERNHRIKHNYDCYSLEMVGRYAKRFFQRVGFNFSRKQNVEIHYTEKNLSRGCSHDVIPNSLEFIQHLIDVSNNTYYDFLKNHNIFVNSYCNSKPKHKTENICRQNVIQLYSLFRSCLLPKETEYWDRVISDKIVWCPITSIEESKNETFDFSLPDEPSDFWCHSVIYNGVIGHQTPRGVGNFFHKMWQSAESDNTNSTVGRNGFHPITLPWHLHPDRDDEWRAIEGGKIGDPKKASQEYDCNFLASGDNVIDLNIIEFYKKNRAKDPLEIRGADKGLWVWEYPKSNNTYAISADVARGDGGDFSACHVLDITNPAPIQVAEYRGSYGTKDFGNFLVALATEYNNAILIVERENVGWATLQQIIDRNYSNTFYSSADLKYVDVQRQLSNKYDSEERKMVPGFSTNVKTRPLVISNVEQYFREMAVEVYSKRLLSELETFIWKNGKPMAMDGYNDDLVMSLGIGLWVRDTAIRLRQEGIELTRASIGHISMKKMEETPVFKTSHMLKGQNAWKMTNPKLGTGTHFDDDIKWLLG